MRIGLVSAEYPPAIGGVGEHTARLAAALGAEGHTVQVLTTGRERAFRAAEAGATTIFRSIPRWDWRILATVGRLAHRQAWDVVHVQYQPAAYDLRGAITLLPWWLRRQRSAAAIVTTFHDLRVPYLFPKAGALRQLAVRQMARSSHGLIAVAEEDQAPLAAWTIGAGRRAVLEWVPLGSHFDAPPPADFTRDAWRASLDVPPGALLLGHLGLVNRSKGIDQIVAAVGRLRSAGRDVRLLMIGETLGASDPTNAAYLDEVHQLIARLALSPYVHWTGYEPADRAAGWLRCLDLAVLPFTDGPTLRRTSLIGAWSQGVPVLTTEPHLPVSWLHNQPTAATVPTAAAEALAQAIAHLADRPDERQTLAQAGLAMSAQFTWPEVARRTLAVYRAARRVQGA